MKKLIFLLSLLSFLPASFAEWTYVGTDEYSNSKIAINLDMMSRGGDIVSTLILIDQEKQKLYYDHPNLPFLSSIHLIALHCGRKKIVQGGAMLFSKNHADGVVMLDNMSSKIFLPWDYIIPVESLDILFPHFCKS